MPAWSIFTNVHGMVCEHCQGTITNENPGLMQVWGKPAHVRCAYRVTNGSR